MRKFILASASPRRASLLQRLGLPFEVSPSGASEALDASLPPLEHVCEIAARKMRAVAAQHPNAIVLGADTVVALGDAILEKPRDAQHAVAMLSQLSGNTHEVLTGLALTDTATGQTLTDVAVTRVAMRALSEQDIERYVATGEPLDKAGAYGVQGHAAIFVESISGCFYNVVGLPLTALWQLLHQLTGQTPWTWITPESACSDLLSYNA